MIIFPLDEDVGSGLLSEETILARVAKRHGELKVDAKLQSPTLPPPPAATAGTSTDPPTPSPALQRAATDFRRAVAECEPSVYWHKDGENICSALQLIQRDMESQDLHKAALLTQRV